MDQASSTPETILDQWDQPSETGHIAGLDTGKAMLLAGSAACALFVLAYFLRELNYALAGVAIVVAVIALQSQNKAGALNVAITNQRIIIGKREYLITDFAGFWLDTAGGIAEINLEMPKGSLVPTSFLYRTSSLDEARAIMSQLLPEMEPRQKKLGDKIGSYFRL